MDAAQLARWTRFAAKGGIGKCTAVCDCVAQNSDELMFLEGDEIVVLMQVADTDDFFLGSCEDIIGRFRGKDVRFHGRLKRPVMTKRSSVSTAKSPSPNVGTSTPASSPLRSSSLSRKDQTPTISLTRSALQSVSGPVDTLSSPDDEGLNLPSLTISAPSTPSDSIVATPPRVLEPTPPRSLGSDSTHSVKPPYPSSPPSQSPRIVLSASPPLSPAVISPLHIVKKNSPTSPIHYSTFAAAQEQLLNGHTSISSSVVDNTYSTYDDPPSRDGDSDGEVGIGLSLLQDITHGLDSDDDSDIERVSVQYDDESTVEGLLYDEPTPDVHTQSNHQIPAPTPRVHVKQGPTTSQDTQGQLVSFPSRSSSPLSPASPTSLASPPPHRQQFSISSRRPSLQSSSSWEGAGDIYDDYRYSRASMISGASRGKRSSISSRMSANSKASHRDAWEGHVYEQPPPIPDPRPSVDSIFANEASNKGANEAAQRSVESRKSAEARKSNGSRKSSESESRRSRQELLFPQPPTNVNIQHELLDQVARESLRRTSEASRILTPADFRLSVESEASIYSRLSVIEQEPVGNTESHSSPPVPESPERSKAVSSSRFLRPSPLDLVQNRSPLLHTTWASPTPSPSDPTFYSATSPTSSLLMPTALTTFTAGMASALRHKVETDRKPEDEKAETPGNMDPAEETLREIVVDDDEDIPSGVVQESTFDTEYSQDTTVDTSKDTIVLPESLRAAPREDLESRTPSPTSPLQEPDTLGELGPPISPVVPFQPPAPEDLNLNPSPEPSPLPSTPSALTIQATLSHIRSPRPTLADLREGGGAPIPGTNQRRSLFLPHPNAPKAPTMTTSGPMYIASQQPSPGQAQHAPVPAPKQSIFEVMHIALHNPPPPAMRPRLMSRGPTIYGRTDADLHNSTGPVPITFSVEPLPCRPPHQPPSPQPPRHLSPPSQTSPFGAPVPPSPTSPPAPRSNTSSPALTTPVPRNELNGDRSSGASDVDGLGNGRTSGVIPRANFFPKPPGARPRSRSFSSFNPHLMQAEVPLPMSQEEGSVSRTAPTAHDVRQSLRPTARSSFSSPTSQDQVTPSKAAHKASPRPSPLSARSSLLKPGNNNPVPKPPNSPLSKSFRPPSISNPTPLSPATSTPNIPSLRHPHQLRQVSSSATLNDAALSRPSLSSAHPSSSSLTSRQFARRSPIPLHDQPASRDQPESDSASIHSDNRSHITSPTPMNRQTSLRTKLSLPNLRRNRSKTDDSLTSPIAEHEIAGTVQVEDLDFELIRPTIQFQQARSSEDSGVLGRETSVELTARDALLQRAASPSGSRSAAKSPTGESFGAWPRPSLSSTGAPVVTRAAVDTELNMDAHRQRESKWMTLIGSVAPSQWRKNKKVRKLIHEGVPSSVRYLIWSHLTDGKAKVVPGVYYQLGNRDRIAAANMIEEDIRTCFQDQPHLQGKRGPVLALLQAYLTMVPDVQYTMGLTLIAGQLLLHAPEEDAFWIFVSVMDTHIRPYFSSSTTQMEVDATLFSRVVETNDAQVAKKIYVDMGIEPSAICVPWFSTLFVTTLPPDYVNRVWDFFLFEGIPFLLRVGFAVMTCCRRQILAATSPDLILQYLQHPSAGWLPSTPDAFISLVHSVKMKDDDVRKNRLKMEAQVKRQTQAQNPRHLPITTTISLPRA